MLSLWLLHLTAAWIVIDAYDEGEEYTTAGLIIMMILIFGNLAAATVLFVPQLYSAFWQAVNLLQTAGMAQ